MEEQNTVVQTATTKDPLTNTVVKTQKVARGNTLPESEFALAKFNQVIWYIAHLLAVFLLIRFILLILGANPTGIVVVIYNITDVLVAPFKGIFSAPVEGESYFDTAALLAIAFYYIVALIITSFLKLLSKRNVEEI